MNPNENGIQNNLEALYGITENSQKIVQINDSLSSNHVEGYRGKLLENGGLNFAQMRIYDDDEHH